MNDTFLFVRGTMPIPTVKCLKRTLWHCTSIFERNMLTLCKEDEVSLSEQIIAINVLVKLTKI